MQKSELARGNADRVELPGGGTVYLHRSASSHDTEGAYGEDLGYIPDALAFEWSANDDLYHSGLEGAKLFASAISTDHEYGIVAKPHGERGVPLYAIDFPISDHMFDSELSAMRAYGMGGGVLAAISLLILVALRRTRKNVLQPFMTRRSAIKGAAAVSLFSGAFLTLPAAGNKLFDFWEEGGQKSAAGKIILDSVSRLIEAEGLLPIALRLRNLVMAEKICAIAHDLQSRGNANPKIGAFIGSMHDFGIARALLLDANERARMIRGLVASSPRLLSEYRNSPHLLDCDLSVVLKSERPVAGNSRKEAQATILWSSSEGKRVCGPAN